MATVDTLLVEVTADLKDVRRKLGQLEKDTKRTADRSTANLKKLSVAFKTLAGAVIVREFVRAGQAAVDFASHVEEAQAKSSVVFGRFTDKIRSDLKEFADEVGRSEFQLEEMAASVQDTFVPMGVARGEAADLSVQLAKLATDVASFNNASDVETMRNFQSALVGNHETVRRYGVVITESALQQELFRMGITKSKDEVTAAEKIQARLNLIMAGTTDAQGDAARTATSYANQVKRMESELDRLRKQVGEKLMPVFLSFVQSISDGSEALREFLGSITMPQLNELTTANHEYQKALEAVEEAQIRVNETRDAEGMERLFQGVTAEARANDDLARKKVVLAEAEERLNAAREQQKKDQEAARQALEKQLEAEKKAAAQREAENEQKKNTMAVNDALNNSFANLSDGVSTSVMEMVTGVGDGMETLRNTVGNIINQIIKKFIEFAIVNKVINSLFGAGGVFKTEGFEKLPTMELASGGAMQPNQPTLVGERGPELIIPKSASVVKNAMNTRNMMGGGAPVVVNQSLNFSTGVQQTVRAEIAELMPSISESAKAAVYDAKQRGGSFGRAF